MSEDSVNLRSTSSRKTTSTPPKSQKKTKNKAPQHPYSALAIQINENYGSIGFITPENGFVLPGSSVKERKGIIEYLPEISPFLNSIECRLSHEDIIRTLEKIPHDKRPVIVDKNLKRLIYQGYAELKITLLESPQYRFQAQLFHKKKRVALLPAESLAGPAPGLHIEYTANSASLFAFEVPFDLATAADTLEEDNSLKSLTPFRDSLLKLGLKQAIDIPQPLKKGPYLAITVSANLDSAQSENDRSSYAICFSIPEV